MTKLENNQQEGKMGTPHKASIQPFRLIETRVHLKNAKLSCILEADNDGDTLAYYHKLTK